VHLANLIANHDLLKFELSCFLLFRTVPQLWLLVVVVVVVVQLLWLSSFLSSWLWMALAMMALALAATAMAMNHSSLLCAKRAKGIYIYIYTVGT
jgi:hypothetical protein